MADKKSKPVTKQVKTLPLHKHIALGKSPKSYVGKKK